MTLNSHNALRHRLAKGAPLANGRTIDLGTLDHDKKEIEIVRYVSPIVSVNVVSEDGHSPKNVQVSAEYFAASARIRNQFILKNGVHSDVGFEEQKDGRFRSLGLLPDERIKLTAVAEGFEPKSDILSLPEGATRELTLTLKPNRLMDLDPVGPARENIEPNSKPARRDRAGTTCRHRFYDPPEAIPWEHETTGSTLTSQNHRNSPGQSLLTLRDLVHAACPEVEEAMKWSRPHFVYKGLLCGMSAFKEHCAFGFWNGSVVAKSTGEEGRDGMGQFGRITQVADLPSKKILTGYIKEAMKLNDAGIKSPTRTKPKTPREVIVPDDWSPPSKRTRKPWRPSRNSLPATSENISNGSPRPRPRPLARSGSSHDRMAGRGKAAELEVHELLSKGDAALSFAKKRHRRSGHEKGDASLFWKPRLDRGRSSLRRRTRLAMTASSQAVRSASVAANGADSSRMRSASIVSRLAVRRVSMSTWS